MDTCCFEVKRVHRDDCVSALMVRMLMFTSDPLLMLWEFQTLRQAPHLMVTYFSWMTMSLSKSLPFFQCRPVPDVFAWPGPHERWSTHRISLQWISKRGCSFGDARAQGTLLPCQQLLLYQLFILSCLKWGTTSSSLGWPTCRHNISASSERGHGMRSIRYVGSMSGTAFFANVCFQTDQIDATIIEDSLEDDFTPTQHWCPASTASMSASLWVYVSFSSRRIQTLLTWCRRLPTRMSAQK